MATVVCEQHGLRYDPERASGCVLCRREQGAGQDARAAAMPHASRRGGIGPAVALTFGIWLVSGFLLFSAHRAVVAGLQEWRGGAGSDDNDALYAAEDATEDDPDGEAQDAGGYESADDDD